MILWLVLGTLAAATVLTAITARHRSQRELAEPRSVTDVDVFLEQLRRVQEWRSHEQAPVQCAVAARRRMYALAYDQALAGCAAALGIDGPPLPLTQPLNASEELHLEVELAARGLRW